MFLVFTFYAKENKMLSFGFQGYVLRDYASAFKIRSYIKWQCVYVYIYNSPSFKIVFFFEKCALHLNKGAGKKKMNPKIPFY